MSIAAMIGRLLKLWSLPVVVLGLCLSGPAHSLYADGVVGTWFREIALTFRDCESQWMVFACLGVYFITFTLLGKRERAGCFWSLSNPNLWLVSGLLIATMAYAFDYEAACKSTDALVLLGGIVLGKAAALWARWETASSEDGRLKMEDGRKGRVMVLLVIFVAVAVFIQNDAGMRFQYRGQARWNGPWDNPNIFGMLMGVGVVLAVGRSIRLKSKGQRLKEEPGVRSKESESKERDERSTFNIQHSTTKAKAWEWLKVVFFLVAAGTMSVGLVKSYSRGAWVATAVGLGYLALNVLKCQVSGVTCQESRVQCQEEDSLSRGSCGSRFAILLRRNLVPLASICVALFVIAFWNFRHTERPLARRAFSAGNINDFSWRNRIATWEGALQIMAERPWLGVGWNQPQRVYDQYYRPAKVAEGMAIQLNDYFMLGTTLGIPALACFLAYIGMALNAKCQVSSVRCQDRLEKTAVIPNPVTCHSSLAPFDNLSPVTCHLSPAMICRAGAIVLLVGFWFDGGLFKLATGATFWILLELGREN